MSRGMEITLQVFCAFNQNNRMVRGSWLVPEHSLDYDNRGNCRLTHCRLCCCQAPSRNLRCTCKRGEVWEKYAHLVSGVKCRVDHILGSFGLGLAAIHFPVLYLCFCAHVLKVAVIADQQEGTKINRPWEQVNSGVLQHTWFKSQYVLKVLEPVSWRFFHVCSLPPASILISRRRRTASGYPRYACLQ